MEAKKDFEIGDLVWAKMKYFQYWPAKIVKPPTGSKLPSLKKVHHYVFFLGSEDYAWIPDENIVHHSDEMLQTALNKKKQSASFKFAVKKMNEESQSASKKTRSPLKNKESPKKSPEESTSSGKKKITNVKKSNVKSETPKIQKKATSKRQFLDESANQQTSPPPPPKVSKRNEDYFELLSNTPPNIGYKQVAVIKPSAPTDPTNSICSSGNSSHDYFALPRDPILDLQQITEAIRAKNVIAIDKKIGFIGLGMMGQRLVKNLIMSGHNMTIWNRTPEKCLEFVKSGALYADSPGAMIEQCDLIFCCVSDSEASKSVVFGTDGILSGLEKFPRRARGFIEMTTIDPTTSKEIAEALKDKNLRYLEAPISGSRHMAVMGTLVIVGAGNRKLFNKCESCFYSIAKHAYYLGPEVGSVSTMNIIRSMVMGISHATLAEAIALIERCGLPPMEFLEILSLGPLNCPLLTEKGQAMVSRSFSTNFPLKHQKKDMDLALALGNMHGQRLSLAETANTFFRQEQLRLYSDHDVSACFLGAKE